ncbi:MAG TPA: hypothetical protein VGP25_14775 [Gemmatimonadaceae bacterium]|jgi:hypothetical protein|nr:hypothetical protein [Gemmatimonadaceae bacterium]
MIKIELRLATITLLALTVSCVSTPRSAGARHGDAAAITEEQLAQRHYQNLFEAVQALRSNWLSSRGTDSFQTPSQVWVYVDDTRFGGLETLASIPTLGVTSVTHLNGIDATARWGLGHAAGVISVHTWPAGARDTVAGVPAGKDTAAARTP